MNLIVFCKMSKTADSVRKDVAKNTRGIHSEYRRVQITMSLWRFTAFNLHAYTYNYCYR